MGAFLSRLWSDIAHLMGWQIPQTQTASQNVLQRQPDSTRVDADDELMVDAPSDFTPLQESETGDTSLRRRVRKTPERDLNDRDSEPPSPRKSNWEESSEHPKPKLDTVPPTKKTKEDKKEENHAAKRVETTQFQSSPNVQFGNEGCPESLLPDSKARISVYAELLSVLNGQVDDTPTEQPHLLQSRKDEPPATDALQTNSQNIDQDEEIRRKSAGGEGESPDNPIVIFGEEEFEILGDAATEDPLQINSQNIDQDEEIRGKNAGGQGESPDNPIVILEEEESEILGGAGEGIENTEKEFVESPNTLQTILSENLKLSSVVDPGQDSDKITSQEDAGRVDAAPELIQENPEQPCYPKIDSEENSEMTDDSVESSKEPPEHPRYKIDDYEEMDSEEEEKMNDSLESPKESPVYPRYMIDDYEKMDSEGEEEKTNDSLGSPKKRPEHPHYQMDDYEEDCETSNDSLESPKESQEHPCYQTGDAVEVDDYLQRPQQKLEHPEIHIQDSDEIDIQEDTETEDDSSEELSSDESDSAVISAQKGDEMQDSYKVNTEKEDDSLGKLLSDESDSAVINACGMQDSYKINSETEDVSPEKLPSDERDSAVISAQKDGEMQDSDKINTETEDDSLGALSIDERDSATISAQKEDEIQDPNLVMSSEKLENLQDLPQDSAEVYSDSVISRDSKFVAMGHQEAQECCLHDIYTKDTEYSKDLTKSVESKSDSSCGILQEEDLDDNTSMVLETGSDDSSVYSKDLTKSVESKSDSSCGILQEEDLDDNTSMVLETGSDDSSVDGYVFQGLKVAIDVLGELDAEFQEQQHKDSLQDSGEEAEQHNNAPELVDHVLHDAERSGVSLEHEIKANSTDLESRKQFTELESDGADVVKSSSDITPNKDAEMVDAASASLGSDMDLTCEISERDLNEENVAYFTDKKEQNLNTETAEVTHKNLILGELDAEFQEQQHKDSLQDSGEEAEQHNNAPELVDHVLHDAERSGVSLEHEIKANSTDLESRKQFTELESDGADVVKSSSDITPNKDAEMVDAASASLGSDMDLTCEISERDLNEENVAYFTDKKEQNLNTETAEVTHKNRENQINDSDLEVTQGNSPQEINDEVLSEQGNLRDKNHCSQSTELTCQQESEIECSTAGNTVENNGNTVENNGNTVENNGNTVETNGNTVENNGNTMENNGNTVENNGNTVEDNGKFAAEEEILQVNGVQVQNFSADDEPNLPQNYYLDIKPSNQVNVQWFGSAEEVFITGSWLDWDGRVRLEKSDENVWSADVEFDQSLKEIKLKFIVDGIWVTSPDMPSVFDGFGNRNNIIRLTH